MRQVSLFINGIYEDVLQEIIVAQEQDPSRVCFLQPYSPKRIKLLGDNPPSPNASITLYASTSLKEELSTVSYSASIVGWEDKYGLSNQRRGEVVALLRQWQPGEARFADEIERAVLDSRNLVSVREMHKLEEPYSVAQLIKRSDGLPLATNRTMAGGWSPVYRL